VDLGRNRGKSWWAQKAADRLSSCGEIAAKVLPPLLKANYRNTVAKKIAETISNRQLRKLAKRISGDKLAE
jgi:hypothetical protein